MSNEEQKLPDEKAGRFFFRASAADFKKIPGSPIAYWAGAAGFAIYEEAVSLKSKNKALTGMRTGDNELFLRRWQEVPWKEVGLHHTKKKAAYSAKKWFPYNKGGDFNKWYGNNELLVNWENDGAEIKDLTRRNYPQLGDNLGWKITNEFMYFKHGITWGGLTSSIVSFRWSDSGALFDSNKGAMMFPNDEERFLILGFLNSTVVRFLLNAVNPTLSTQNSDIDALPWLVEKLDKTKIDVSNVVKRILSFSKGDDNAFETSWDFTSLPLLQVTSAQCPVASEEENPEFQLSTGHYPLATKLSFSYAKLRVHWRETTLEMQRLEEENNRIFIDAYGLQDELTPEVPLNEITLTCNPHYRFSSVASGQGLVTREEELEAKLLADTMKEFISYAVGCMFGRYSLDAPGLILANQGEGLEDYYRIVSNQLSVISNQQEEKADYCTLTSDVSYDSFPPDADNVIPFLDGEWFPDDITERFRKFLRVTFGEEHYEENLKFIEVALGKDIRKYFLKDFYNDHLRRYKKRPIYWLFSSPKGSFNALIYMHRYRPDTVSVVLNGYLREFRTKLLSRKSQLEAVSISASASPGEKTKALKEIESLRKMIEELESYERDVLYPLATEQLEIDLDDGVKVNYQKFGPALKKIPGLDAKEE